MLRRGVLGAVIALVIAFYYWTAHTGQERSLWPNVEVQDYDFYNHLANGFASGHLYLDTRPRPELLELPDPFDAVANAPYRLHDASLYQGHYYIYWGPVPVLLLFLPYHLISGGGHIPENTGVMIFGAGAYLASCLLFFALRKRIGIAIPLWLESILVLALGLCGYIPWMLRRPLFYECAILSAALCVQLGLYGWLRGLESERSRWWLILAGLGFGCAAGSRPQFALVAMAFVAAVAAMAWWRERRFSALLRREVLWAAIPVAICGLALMSYNYARFGSVTEFGLAHQLSVTRDEGVRPTFQKFLAGLYYYLLHPYRQSDSFPFVFAQGGLIFDRIWVKGEFIEPVLGLFPTTPLYLLGFCFPLLPWWRNRARTAALRTTLWGTWGVAIAGLVLICPFGWAILRYEMDFAAEFLVLSVLWAALAFSCITRRWLRYAAGVAVTAACLYGAGVNVLISFTGFANGLERFSPATFDRMERFFSGLGLGERCVEILDVESEIPPPLNATPGARTLMLQTGVDILQNRVTVEWIDAQRYRIRYQQSGAADLVSRDLAAPAPGNALSVHVRYQAEQKRLSILSGGTEALWAPAVWYPPINVQAGPSVQLVRKSIRRTSPCEY